MLADDQFFMRLAIQQAEKAYELGEVPVGAIIVYKQQVIAKAHNQTESLQDITAHAEILCITAASHALGGKYLTDCKLYVTLEPCAMCAGAIAWAQLGELIFAAEDPKRGYRRYTPSILHPKTIMRTGILQSEAQQLLQSFFRQLRN